MEKLGDITVENSFNVTVNCQVDQHLLAKNFTTLINALKELQTEQHKAQSQLNGLASLKDQFDQFGSRIDRIEKNNSSDSTHSNNSNSNLSGIDSHTYDNLVKRIDKNEANILDNIKDINLINKELTDLKRLIDQLRNQTGNSNPHSEEKSGRSGYGVEDIASNMSKELSKSSQKMKELEIKLMKAEEQISKHDKEINQLIERNKNRSGSNQASSGEKGGREDLEDLKRDLRQKLDVINRKINNLQSDSDSHEQDINYLKDINAQRQNNDENEKMNANPQSAEELNIGITKQDFNQLKRKIDEVDRRENKDVKNIMEELNNIKSQLKTLVEKVQSKFHSEEEGRNQNRKSTINKDDSNDKLNDLIMRVTYLEKLLAGSKSQLQEKNPQKLPAINRPKRRDPNMTGFNEKEKSGISRRDLGELKAELQAWIKGLFDENRDRENIEDIELKLQEIKRSLERKADAEGTKKGFSFLQNKITQLYLFLTQPDTEDAMIVRKGFNCLSCSKRVEKLRGRIGPKLNWNNMTTTNYSPPRVGYSKPMGEQSNEQQDI